jgi:hypothetical protein
MQCKNLKAGVSGVGIPDLLIIQNVLQNDLSLFSLDKHFKVMSNIHNCSLYLC